jgi:hypothetical protein
MTPLRQRMIADMQLRFLSAGTQLMFPRIIEKMLENEEAFIRSGRWKYIYCSGRRAPPTAI